MYLIIDSDCRLLVVFINARLFFDFREEYVSKASSAHINKDRSLAAMPRKKIGTKTDILFTTEYLEFGTVEAGKISDVNSTKTFYEVGMKLPKNLKDMQYDLIQECPSKLKEIKTCGIGICG